MCFWLFRILLFTGLFELIVIVDFLYTLYYWNNPIFKTRKIYYSNSCKSCNVLNYSIKFRIPCWSLRRESRNSVDLHLHHCEHLNDQTCLMYLKVELKCQFTCSVIWRKVALNRDWGWARTFNLSRVKQEQFDSIGIEHNPAANLRLQMIINYSF